jgi:hypothetical protein
MALIDLRDSPKTAFSIWNSYSAAKSLGRARVSRPRVGLDDATRM